MTGLFCPQSTTPTHMGGGTAPSAVLPPMPHAHRSSDCPFPTDLCVTGAWAHSPALDERFPFSCGLHVLPVALTVSTTPPTRRLSGGGGGGTRSCTPVGTSGRGGGQRAAQHPPRPRLRAKTKGGARCVTNTENRMVSAQQRPEGPPVFPHCHPLSLYVCLMATVLIILRVSHQKPPRDPGFAWRRYPLARRTGGGATGAGAHQGQTNREGEKDIWWTARTARGGTGHLSRTETQRGRLWTACGQRCVDSKNSQTTPATTSTSSIRQLLGATDTQRAHHATFSTVPTHQLLGSANAETTPARAPAAAADRKLRPDATCEGKNG